MEGETGQSARLPRHDGYVLTQDDGISSTQLRQVFTKGLKMSIGYLFTHCEPAMWAAEYNLWKSVPSLYRRGARDCTVYRVFLS